MSHTDARYRFEKISPRLKLNFASVAYIDIQDLLPGNFILKVALPGNLSAKSDLSGNVENNPGN